VAYLGALALTPDPSESETKNTKGEKL